MKCPVPYSFPLDALTSRSVSPEREMAYFLHLFIILDYSQVEVAADARHRVRSCGPSPRVPCNETDAVRSACLNGKKMAIKIIVKTDKKFQVVFFVENMFILESKIKK